MTTTTPDVLRLRTPVDLIHAVPYLLRFTPTDSLVLIALQEKKLIVTARLDLGDTDTLLTQTMAALTRAGATQVVALAYTDLALSPAQRHQLTARVQSVAHHAGIRLAVRIRSLRGS